MRALPFDTMLIKTRVIPEKKTTRKQTLFSSRIEIIVTMDCFSLFFEKGILSPSMIDTQQSKITSTSKRNNRKGLCFRIQYPNVI